MMVYFDTNVLIYAFTQNVDDEKQKNISVQMVGEAIEKGFKKLKEIAKVEMVIK